MTLRFISLILLVAACDKEGEKKKPVPACNVAGNICTWSGIPGQAMFSPEGEHRLDAPMYLPQDVVFSSDGMAYFPDFNNHRIRQIDADGIVYTISGTGMLGDGPIGATSCFAPTPCDALNSAWNHPTGIAVRGDEVNKVYVAAWHNSRISLIDTEQSTLAWYAGTGGRYFDAGTGLQDAILDLPSSVDFDERTGLLYFSDQANHLIRRINADGTISTIAGIPRSPGYTGDGGSAIDAQIHGHTDQKADPGSKMDIHDGMLYFTDTVNGVIRAIDLDNGTIDRIAGVYTSQGEQEFVDPVTEEPYTADIGSVPGYSGDGGDALDAVFNTPRDVAVSPDGTQLYIADTKNSCIRVIDLVTGTIERFAGVCGEWGFDGDEGPAIDAKLNEPFGVAVDSDGNVYIADTLNHVIRRVKVD